MWKSYARSPASNLDILENVQTSLIDFIEFRVAEEYPSTHIYCSRKNSFYKRGNNQSSALNLLAQYMPERSSYLHRMRYLLSPAKRGPLSLVRKTYANKQDVSR